MLNFVPKGFKGRYSYIVGCDEVGRGCLAGPVVAASVVFGKGLTIKDKGLWAAEVRDSKLLSPKVRQQLSVEIKRVAHLWSVGVVSPKIIDNINIHNASLRAMKQALVKVSGSLDGSYVVFVDGKFPVPNINVAQEAIVDGDAKVFSIAAASIIAKVYRDNLMAKLHGKLPHYGFQNHKGYATVEHRKAIIKYGLSEHHRISFCSKYV